MHADIASSLNTVYQCKYVLLLSDDGNILPLKVLH